MEEAKTEKPQSGAWENTEAYPQKIRFVQDKPVVVTFDANFKEPKEMPSKDNRPDNACNDVFYIFECLNTSDNKKSSIVTSSWTLLRSLKSHLPLAGKTLIITKKNVGGKNMFYVETDDQNAAREAATPSLDCGIDEQGNL